MPKFYLEIFPPPQRKLWDQLKKQASFLSRQGYYLAGGSGLALQLGHRQSVDFDFFSKEKTLSSSTQEWLSQFTRLTVRDSDPDTLHAEADGVKVSFISAYRYATVEPLAEAEGIPLAGPIDIALMKLLAVTHRAVLRDYIDMAAILQSGVDLKRLLEASKKKYGQNFNEMICLRSLVTFMDIDSELPLLIDKNLQRSWRAILTDAVKKAAA